MKNPELLAPAGNIESLRAALRCGADAVYIGGRSFSARQNAVNFDIDEMKEASKYCHLYGKKIYLAVNTIIFDDQAKEFAAYIKKAINVGIDAFIVQDLGAADIIKTISPDARLHASTQMTIHSADGALTAKRLGFKRVVLSRELSKKQIEEISALDIETEIFVHGALCMSVSGQCYLSALIGQRSANRGLCAQPCRLPFSSCSDKGVCGLSLKDLSLAEHMREIIGTGVTSLKIEGRMKRPEYVAASVHAFRNAIDGKPFDMEMLRSVFSRGGFTDGYFTGRINDMFGIREKKDAQSAKSVFPKIHELYRTERKAVDVRFKAVVKKDSPIKLIIYDSNGNSTEAVGSIPVIAEKKSIDTEFLEKQLAKLGGTIYNYNGLNAEIDDGLSVSAGSLNELRRIAVSALDSKRIKTNTPKYAISEAFPKIYGNKKDFCEIRARISDMSQFESALYADRVIVPMNVINTEKITDREKIIIEPPRFILCEKRIKDRLKELKYCGFEHLMCNNIAYIEIGRELGLKIHGDFGLNVSNSYSANMLSVLGFCGTTLSIELKAGQASDIKSPVPTGIMAYGRLPVMLTINCPVKNEAGCKKCKKNITDRTGKKFPLVCYGKYVEILNSQTLYIADKLERFGNIGFMTLYFTNETPSVITEIINDYRCGGSKKENITRGLFFRGAI